MTTAPNLNALTATTAVRPWVRIATAAGSSPNYGSVDVALRPQTIARFAGGGELDVCRFDYNLAATGERIQDVQLLENWNRQIDVRIPTFGAPGGAGVLFWGETATSQLQINPGGETVSIQAVVSPPLFGDILRGMPILSYAGATILSEVDLVFNPLIDGKIVPNKSSRRDATTGIPLFVSPDSVRTDAAQEERQETASLWTLKDAVIMVSFLLNPGETYIKNGVASPLGVDLNDDVLVTAPPLVNVRVKRGDYLPRVLDELLIPLGFNWYVDPGISDIADNPYTPAVESELAANPTIVIYKRGQGRPVYLFFQRIGEALDMRRSNAPEVNVETDVLDLANNVTGHASFIEKEMTIEVYPTWPFDDDEIAVDELDPKVEGSQYHDGKQNVWRRWAANEAGDWNNVRSLTHSIGFHGVWDGGYVTRRRRFFPCLTYTTGDGKVKKRRAPYVEYYDPNAGTEGEGAWLEVPSDWSYKILPDELGVEFTGKRVPGELYQLGANARVRVTGVVVGDHRLESSSTVAGTSPNSNDVDLFIDVSDKFHHRERLETGFYRSRFSVAGLAEEPLNGDATLTFLPADETNDLAELQSFLDNLVDIEQAAKATAVFTLQTIDWSYEIGDVVVGVYGRNISFNRLVPGAGTRYMQITSIVHDFERQTTKIKVESEDGI